MSAPFLPRVSLVLAVRNDAAHLPRCLAAVAAQTYPHDRLELLIADGGSTDGARALARDFAAAPGRDIAVHLLDNPAGRTPAGLNTGIAAAGGDVIVILGARAEIAPDFVAESVAALDRTGADAAGGVVESVPTSATPGVAARAIALALRSPFGVGDARYRYAAGDADQDVDTVNYGAYRRAVFECIGVFDPALQWVEDDEFNYRLRAAGGRLVLSPRIRVRYHARDGLGALWRQQYRWGLNKPRVARRHPAQMRPRHAVPALFVAALLVSGGGGRWLRPLRRVHALILGSYALATAAATLDAGRRQRRREGRADLPALAALPVAFATMHVAYGVGMVLGLARALAGGRDG